MRFWDESDRSWEDLEEILFFETEAIPFRSVSLRMRVIEQEKSREGSGEEGELEKG